MKRSEINQLIRSAEIFFRENKFMLPPWAGRNPGEWKGKYAEESEIIDNMLGWDLTDFGSGDFFKRGLLLFTIRNGDIINNKKTYAEKTMIVEEEQETPLHFHWQKMEDIVVRNGGNLILQLYNSTLDEKLAYTDVELRVDGILRRFPAGGKLVLGPGESVCLPQRVYHRFYGEKDKGKILVGEVSMVNDDTTDNRFFEEAGRFPIIHEDEKPYRLLASDYSNFI